MARPDVRQFAQSGAAEGQIQVWRGTPDEWQPEDLPFTSSYIRDINPENLTTQGNNPTHGEADGYSVLRLRQGATAFGTWSHILRRTPAADPTFTFRFVLEQSGTGTIVRVALKTKARANGEDISTAFDTAAVASVTVTTTTIGEIFEGSITIPSAGLALNDTLGLSIGRDGNNDIAGGASDDFSRAILLVGLELKVP